MKPRISVAMATYNGSKYILEQLNSFARQRVRPDELVICDDGSVDDTVALVKQFARTAPFEVLIHQNAVNLGYSRNFEKALLQCRGDVIFLSDQDDVWLDGKISTVVRVFDEQPDIQLVQVDMDLVDASLRPCGRTQLQNLRSTGFCDASFVAGCGTALRRPWLDVALPVPHGFAGHDAWIHFLAHALGVRILIERPLQLYRRHDANASQGHASSLARVSRLSALKSHGLAPALQGWQQELEKILQTRQRILQMRALLQTMDLGNRVDQAVETLNTRAAAYSERIGLCRLPRHRRLPGLISMYAGRRYRHFAGIGSFVKDVLRP